MSALCTPHTRLPESGRRHGVLLRADGVRHAQALQHAVDDFTCSSDGLENHARYGECIYFHDRDTLYVNLSFASEVNWRDIGMRVTQRTDFPSSEKTRLIFSCASFYCVRENRHPFWAGTRPDRVERGDRPDGQPPPGYAVIRREWKTGTRWM